jgi:hypothetical protein
VQRAATTEQPRARRHRIPTALDARPPEFENLPLGSGLSGLQPRQQHFLVEYRQVKHRVESEKSRREQMERDQHKKQLKAQRLAKANLRAAAAERGEATVVKEELPQYALTAVLVNKLQSQVQELTRPVPRVHIEPLSPTQRLARLSQPAMEACY